MIASGSKNAAFIIDVVQYEYRETGVAWSLKIQYQGGSLYL
jgi:hypothetical protein